MGTSENAASVLLAPACDADAPQRGRRCPPAGGLLPTHGVQCFGCGTSSAAGLGMLLRAGPGCDLTGHLVVGPAHQGAPGLAHGGVIAAALDEALGGLHWVLGVPWVTGQLLTDYVRPVPVGTVLSLRAEVIGVKGRRAYCQGSAHGADENAAGSLYARAAGVFVIVDLEHFTAYGDGFTSEGKVRTEDGHP